jgi:hypothetical protein
MPFGMCGRLHPSGEAPSWFLPPVAGSLIGPDSSLSNGVFPMSQKATYEELEHGYGFSDVLASYPSICVSGQGETAIWMRPTVFISIVEKLKHLVV